jgi:DNA-binding GntR family transcriptional regulator
MYTFGMKQGGRSATRSSLSRKPDARHRETAGRVSLVDRAYREIRRRILDNEYPPSHQVLEHELAADLQMSRTPVREALVRLQNEKFVQLVPRHGMRVLPLSLQGLRDMYEVLTALELTAIERLARSRPDGRTLQPLEQALDDMDLALKQRDRDAWVRADERFHRRLLDLCGNARLAAIAYTLWDHGHRARMTTVRLRPSLEPSNREHRAVVRAIRRGDWRKARAQHARHRALRSGEIMKLLEQVGWAASDTPTERRSDAQTEPA